MIAIFILVVLAIAFLVGSKKLVTAMQMGTSQKNPRMQMVVKSSRLIAGFFLTGFANAVISVVLKIIDPIHESLAFVTRFFEALMCFFIALAVFQLVKFVDFSTSSKKSSAKVTGMASDTARSTKRSSIGGTKTASTSGSTIRGSITGNTTQVAPTEVKSSGNTTVVNTEDDGGGGTTVVAEEGGTTVVAEEGETVVAVDDDDIEEVVDEEEEGKQ